MILGKRFGIIAEAKIRISQGIVIQPIIGIRGDRFYDYRDNYKGQITFFSFEVFERLVSHFGLTNSSPGALRRNVVVSGVDLNDLIGQEFSIQGVRLRGTAHSYF